MKRLALLRHAKSSWAEPALDDFDRPLTRRGRKAAEAMGAELARRGLEFGAVRVSPACRARETFGHFQSGLGRPLDAIFDERIYAASAPTLLGIVTELPDAADSALLIGHNPGFQRLAAMLAAPGDPARSGIESHYPTAALALIDLPVDRWSDVEPGTGSVATWLKPRELKRD